MPSCGPSRSHGASSGGLGSRAPRSGKSSTAAQRLSSDVTDSLPGRPGVEPPPAGSITLQPVGDSPTQPITPATSHQEETKAVTEPAQPISSAPVKPAQPELDTSLTPKAIFSPQPQLPSAVRLLMGREPLDATYLLYITPEGRVSAVDSVRPIPLGDDSIVRTLRLWRYPARKKPLSIPVDFHFPGY